MVALVIDQVFLDLLIRITKSARTYDACTYDARAAKKKQIIFFAFFRGT